jgi:hypothetical protein
MTMSDAPFTSAQLMPRLSQHMDMLAAEVHRVEQTLGGTFEKAPSLGGATIMQLQSLDFLRQSLEDLALLTHTLGRLATEHAPDALDAELLSSKCRLASTRRLMAQVAEADAGPEGTLDLF